LQNFVAMMSACIPTSKLWSYKVGRCPMCEWTGHTDRERSLPANLCITRGTAGLLFACRVVCVFANRWLQGAVWHKLHPWHCCYVYQRSSVFYSLIRCDHHRLYMCCYVFGKLFMSRLLQERLRITVERCKGKGLRDCQVERGKRMWGKTKRGHGVDPILGDLCTLALLHREW
jgi:hypothetical protein